MNNPLNNPQKSKERSLCSPSQLERRYLCPGSANLESQIVATAESGEESEAAKRGIFLHAAVEKVLLGTNINEIIFDSPGDKQAVQWCFERIIEIKAELPGAIVRTEIQVDLSDVGIESGEKGNRIDLLFIVPGELAVIIDYKFGEFWTEPPQYNWQLKAYGYGAFKMFGGKGIRLIKLQPELPEEYRYMSHLIWADEVEKIGIEIKAVVDKTNEENAPLVRGEKQCQFCKARETCPLHRGTVLSIPRHVSIASHLNNISPVERGKLYDDLSILGKWVEKALAIIEGIALNTGIEIEGYEIGHGRSSREWDDPDSALLKMQELARECGIPDDKLIVPEKVISPAEADKVFGKAKKIQTFLSALYTTVEGKLKLKKVRS